MKQSSSLTAAPLRIAMWSGPRNISTALMRAFSSRADCWVIDEPFYAAYLQHTGVDHPLRQEVLASQASDWQQVVSGLLAPLPRSKSLQYQKHMTQHMLPHIDLQWLQHCRSAFLIRDPRQVLASYVKRREQVSLDDIGIVQQRLLFEREMQRLQKVPPVIDGQAVLENPAHWLQALCRALDIDYSDAMLHWPAGPHANDGAWAPAWYQNVEASTGFGPPSPTAPALSPELEDIANMAMPHYQALLAYHLP